MRPHPFVSMSGLLVSIALGSCGGGGGGDAGSDGGTPDDGLWHRDAANPLITPRATATTRYFTAADPCVLEDAATGTWRAWFSSGVEDIASGAQEVDIFTADSTDGAHWTIQAAPALRISDDADAWDHTHVETPNVVRNPDPGAPADRTWLLFYSGANQTIQASQGRPTTFPYYAIGLAASADGRSFTRIGDLDGKPGLIIEAEPAVFTGVTLANNDGAVADPDCVVDGANLVLYFTSYAEEATASGRTPAAFGISRAVSGDGGAHWTFSASNPIPGLTRADGQGGEQPATLRDPATGRYEMWFKCDSMAERASLPTSWYTCLGFWHATSPDGVVWTADWTHRDFIADAAAAYETYGIITGAAVLRDGDDVVLYYAAWGTVGDPDPAHFQVPLQDGSVVPAAATLCRARKRWAPTSTGWRRGARDALAAALAR